MYILFDIGGTKMRVALSRDGLTFAEPKVIPTPQDFTQGVAAFKQLVSELTGGARVLAAGGGLAGPLDKARSMLVNSPHLPGWIGQPLRSSFAAVIDAPVFMENDSAVVGLGEATSGAGRGYPIVAYITVSTGVGGARLVDGDIDRSAFGFEPGHQIIDPHGTLCAQCGAPGDLEVLVSGTAVEKRYHCKPYEITDAGVWDELARYLAYGLHNAILHWSPNVLVLGGSMLVKTPGISVARTRTYLYELLQIFPQKPLILQATLQDVGGLHGALALVKKRLARQN